MAYSGTTTFAITRDQICTRAAAKIGIIDSGNGETLSSGELSDFALQLNVIAKNVMADDAGNAWIRLIGTLFMAPGQAKYTLGNTTTDVWTYGTVVNTSTTSTVSTGTSLVVASVTGLSTTMNIGIKLDTGAFFWTTITGINAGTLTLTLNTTIPSSITSGNQVYCFAGTTQADRPQRVTDVIRRYQPGSIDTILQSISRAVYDQLPQKTLQSIPTQWMYENTISNGTLTVWPTSSGLTGVDELKVITEGLIQDFSSGTDNPYFPIEWADFLIWKLAHQMCFEYDVPMDKRQALKYEAEESLNKLLNYSSTAGDDPIQFGMRQDQGY